MFATYLTAGVAIYVIAVMFALAFCKAAKRGDRQLESE